MNKIMKIERKYPSSRVFRITCAPNVEPITRNELCGLLYESRTDTEWAVQECLEDSKVIAGTNLSYEEYNEYGEVVAPFMEKYFDKLSKKEIWAGSMSCLQFEKYMGWNYSDDGKDINGFLIEHSHDSVLSDERFIHPRHKGPVEWLSEDEFEAFYCKNEKSLFDELKENNILNYKKTVEKLREIVDVQCLDGNWNYSPYSHGLANGLILALSIVDGKSPKFLKASKEWLNGE